MAYFDPSNVAITTVASTGPSELIAMPVHAAGDWLLAFVSSRTRDPAPSAGWTVEQTSTAGVYGEIYSKVAASAAETLTLSYSVTGAALVVAVIAVKAADTAGSIQKSLSTFSSINYKASPALTSTLDGMLVIHAAMVDSTDVRIPPCGVIDAGSGIQTASLRIGYTQQYSAGVVESLEWAIGSSLRSGNVHVIAIPNAAGGAPGFSALENKQPINLWGNVHGRTLTTGAPNSVAGITSILSVPMATMEAALGQSGGSVDWYETFGTAGGDNLASNAWYGRFWTLASPIDLTNALVHMDHVYGSLWDSGRAGPNGAVLVFVDGSGNWAVFQLHTLAAGVVGTQYQWIMPVDVMPPTEQSATPINWSSVAKYAVLYERKSGHTGVVYLTSNLLAYTKTPLVVRGTRGAQKLTAAKLWELINGKKRGFSYSSLQGVGQIIVRSSLQFGDGVNKTEVEFGANSLEFPSYDAKYRPLPNNRLDLRIKASAADVMDFSASILASDSRQSLVIDSTSSLSAQYSFGGTSILGFDVTWKTGVVCTGITFSGCYELGMMGADLVGCTIKGTRNTDSAITFSEDGGSLTRCTIDVTGTSAAYHLELGALVTAITLTDTTFSGTPGTDKVHVLATTGTVTITISGTTSLAAGDVTSDGATVNIVAPSYYRGIAFTGLIAGSKVKVFATGTDTELFSTASSGTSETFNDATNGALTVDYTIQKAGYLPRRVTGVALAGQTTTAGLSPVQGLQTVARWYVASSGLTINTNAFANATTKKWGLTTASTLQNFACYLLEQWIALGDTGEAFANKPFPIEANGPNSFSWLDGWEADLTTYPNSIGLMSRDGMRYLNSGGTATAIWAALLSNGVPAGKQVRYQQADGTGTTNALTTGNIDQLIQIYGDATHGNFDKRNWLVLKVQTLGDYDQAEADAVVTYGTLEDQLYVVGLAPTPNGVPAQAGITGITITSELTPVLWNGQLFSVTITDTTDTHSGTQIMQYVRGLNDFNLHDMIRPNGSKFRTVNGSVYGDTLPTPAGVRVVKADGVTPHPDFDAFSADNGATYAPPVLANISVTGMPDAVGAYNRLQLINSTAKTAAAWQALTAYADGALRLRTSGLGAENTAGLYLRCTTAGTSGALEPVWNTTPGGTTTDGSVTWTTCKVLFYSADPANTAYAASYTEGNEFLAGETIELRFSEMNAGTSFKTFGTTTIAGSSGFSVAVNEQANDVFATYGLNGASYETTFSPNYVGNYIVLDTNTDFSGKAAFAYFCYLLTTDAGMYDFWGGMTALDPGNIRIETDILNLYFDESAGFVKQTDDVRIYRKDGLRPALDPTTGGFGIEINWRTPVSVVSTGGSALTAAQDAKLMGLNPPAAATIVDAVWAKTLP